MSKNPIFCFDFTLFDDNIEGRKAAIFSYCKLHCKKWGFQLEETKDGKLHWQGRFSLKEKKRKAPKMEGAHFSPTSEECSKGEKFYEYVCKERSRVDGPWTDADVPNYIPRQFRDIELYKWQKQLLNKSKDFSDRYINIIVDKKGNIGKSMISCIGTLFHGGLLLPAINDGERLVATACNICMSKNMRKPNPVFIDMPRAMNKDRLNGIFYAVEDLKRGYLYDLRNKYKDWWIDSPSVWLFTNEMPDKDALSRDRWKFWRIVSNELVPFGTDYNF